MRTAHTLAVGWLLLGCGSSPSSDQQPSPRPRGVLPSQIPQEQKQPTATQQPTEQQPIQPEQAPKAVAVAKAEEQEPEKKRDYAVELLGALGSPSDCLETRQGAESPTEIKVELEAHFLETGAMSRGYVRSSQLTPKELQCVRSRLEAVKLPAPIEEAPRTVQASLTFKLKIAETSPN